MYEGSWKEGMRWGTGRYFAVDGSVFSGQWKRNMKHGRGEYVGTDGSKYIGDWQEDLRHGDGKAIYAEGGLYDGPWRRGLPHCEAEEDGEEILGRCSLVDPSGAQYSGSVLFGIKQGFGKLALPNGETYIGFFHEGRFHGDDGILTGPHPLHKFVGTFKCGVRSGKGEQRYANGCSYVGDWEANLFHGQGVLNGCDGNFLNVASGSWKRGLLEGLATMRWEGAHPMTYTGSWAKGCACGRDGELVFADGRRFKGEFRPDNRDDQASGIVRKQHNPHPHILRIARGPGTLTHPNGKIMKGLFRAMVLREGRPVSAVRSLKPKLLPRAPPHVDGRKRTDSSAGGAGGSPRKQFVVMPSAAPGSGGLEQPQDGNQ
jgi:hypothetical protein